MQNCYCYVVFEHSNSPTPSKEYVYYVPWNTFDVHVGDEVLVPVGPKATKLKARVKRIGTIAPLGIPASEIKNVYNVISSSIDRVLNDVYNSLKKEYSFFSDL